MPAAESDFATRQSRGTVVTNEPVSTGLIRLELRLDGEVEFLPGQFAMLNLLGPRKRTFGRPFSILSRGADRLAFLYRVVGGGTADLAAARTGDQLSVLAPLGRPFPAPADPGPAILLAGGVGLPPVLAWWERYARPEDRAYFGGRDVGDVPWMVVPPEWGVSVDTAGDAPAGRAAHPGLVTELAERELSAAAPERALVLACGPLPLLKAAGRLAARFGWDCLVSMEEHMGCGYGACKGCVLPVRVAGQEGDAWRNATCCQEGPVFAAGSILWDRIP